MQCLGTSKPFNAKRESAQNLLNGQRLCQQINLLLLPDYNLQYTNSTGQYSSKECHLQPTPPPPEIIVLGITYFTCKRIPEKTATHGPKLPKAFQM